MYVPLAQLRNINIKNEILGRKFVSSRCDWSSLTTKPSLSSVTELSASWGLIKKKGKYKANKISKKSKKFVLTSKLLSEQILNAKNGTYMAMPNGKCGNVLFGQFLTYR